MEVAKTRVHHVVGQAEQLVRLVCLVSRRPLVLLETTSTKVGFQAPRPVKRLMYVPNHRAAVGTTFLQCRFSAPIVVDGKNLCRNRGSADADKG